MKSSTLLLIIITLLIAGGAYWYVFVGGGEQAPLTATAPDVHAQTQFQTLVSKLQRLDFDTEILVDPKFLSLIDLKTPITEESKGRPDPFAPVPGVAGI